MGATGGGAAGGAGAGAGAASPYASGAMAGMSLISAFVQSDAQKAQGEFANKMADINARRSELAANDAIRRGENEAAKYGQQVRQVIGSQKTNLAAQGIVVSSGDAQTLQTQAKETGALNVESIRNNAYREAMGFRQAANEASSRGRVASATANFNANATIAAGGMRALGYMKEGGFFDSKGSKDAGTDVALNTRNKSEETYRSLFGDDKEMVS